MANKEYEISPWKQDFPILDATIINKNPLVYLDTAASAQKPKYVLETCLKNYESEYANVHRGIHYLSEEETANFEAARMKIQKFINAKSPNEIIFTRGATEALNLIAYSFGKKYLKEGDEIIISLMEHHANIVPWQILKEEKNISIKVIPVYDDGSLNYDAFLNLLSPKTKLVSITHMSNVLGTINPVKKITTEAHNAGAKVIIDGSQAITHFPIDVSDIDCDFFAFSGHKLYAPTGIGVLYGRENILHELPPWQGGGDMIKSVTMEKSIWADPPAKFEAGTPPIVQAIGLGAAIDYLNTIGMQNLHAFEQTIFNNMYYELKNIKGLKILGNAPEKGGLVSWVMEKIHPQDISMILNQMGIAVRVGHHCAQPITERMGVSASCRASIGIYNGLNDVKKLISGIYKVKDLIK